MPIALIRAGGGPAARLRSSLAPMPGGAVGPATGMPEPEPAPAPQSYTGASEALAGPSGYKTPVRRAREPARPHSAQFPIERPVKPAATPPQSTPRCGLSLLRCLALSWFLRCLALSSALAHRMWWMWRVDGGGGDGAGRGTLKVIRATVPGGRAQPAPAARHGDPRRERDRCANQHRSVPLLALSRPDFCYACTCVRCMGGAIFAGDTPIDHDDLPRLGRHPVPNQCIAGQWLHRRTVWATRKAGEQLSSLILVITLLTSSANRTFHSNRFHRVSRRSWRHLMMRLAHLWRQQAPLAR